VTVLNDHRNLVWLRSNESSSKCVRWSMVLDEYSITWRHLPSKATLAQEEDATVPDGLSRSFGNSPVPISPRFISDREERLMADLDVQLSALSVEAVADGVQWDARAPLEEQMAVLVLCMQACEKAEPAFICALGADRATRIAERDATKAAAAEALALSRAAAAAEQHAEQQPQVDLAATGQQAVEPLAAVRAVPVAEASGISESALLDWVARGTKAGPDHPDPVESAYYDFACQFKEARASAEVIISVA
jgi:hypothetical protein